MLSVAGIFLTPGTAGKPAACCDAAGLAAPHFRRTETTDELWVSKIPAAHFETLYPQFDDFGGLRKSAEFWSGFAFNASNALQRLKQRPKVR